MPAPTELIPLETGCEWRRDDLGDSYVVELSDEHLAEIDAAVDHAEARTDDVLDITRDDFPLPTLGRLCTLPPVIAVPACSGKLRLQLGDARAL